MLQIMKTDDLMKHNANSLYTDRYAMLLLYDVKDRDVMNLFFKRYGLQTNNSLGLFPLYTCYDQGLVDEWGPKMAGYTKQRGKDPMGDPYYKMKRIGASYGVLTYPTLIFIDLGLEKNDINYFTIDVANFKADEIYNIINNIIVTVENNYDNFDAIKNSLDIKVEVERKPLDSVFRFVGFRAYIKRIIDAKNTTLTEVLNKIDLSEGGYTKKLQKKTVDIEFIDSLADALELCGEERKSFYKTLILIDK